MSESSVAARKREHRARVYSCSGGTRLAQLAQEIAARLDRLGITAAGQAPAVAIDGCPSACARRTLEAKGVQAAAIGLHELGVRSGDDLDKRARNALLRQVVERLQALGQAPAREPVPRRRPPVTASGAERRAHTADDYLYAVYILTSPVVSCGALATDSPTIAAHVARLLSVSRPAAGEMLAQLEAAGQIVRGPGKEILLTAEGRAAAEQVARRHRVVERFLTDFLDYPAAESHDLAVQVRAGFDETMIDRIAAQLAPPACCPHGWPIDPAGERERLAELVALFSLPPRTPATVAALAEHDAELLARLYELGLEPGVRVEVRDRSQRTLTVDVDGEPRPLDQGEATAVLVKALPQ